MMGGNPSEWWSMMMMMMDNGNIGTSMHSSQSSSQHFLVGSSNSFPHNSTQDFPCSWSQLLLDENEKYGKEEKWEEEQSLNGVFSADVKQEFPRPSLASSNSSASSSSAPTSLSHNYIFNFSSSTTKKENCNNHHDSSECNSTSSGGASKKPKIHHPSPQPSLKVRKEKLGDKISTLHQIVSPFGKTDTASVLSEAIGYVRFLHSQIQALSTPMLGKNPSASMGRHTHQQSNQWLNGGSKNNLRSKGLCLVPVSCIQHAGIDSVGTNYWSPAHDGSF